MTLELTFSLCLRDDERGVPGMVRSSVAVAEALSAERLAGEGGEPGHVSFEMLALDEGSRDNTLSALSILHSKHPQLRTLQNLEPGTAVMRSARTASF